MLSPAGVVNYLIMDTTNIQTISQKTINQAWNRQLSVLPWSPVRPARSNPKTAVIDYINSLDWSYYLTGSTRYELTLKSERRLFERWYDSFKAPGSRLFWVGEKFEVKDGYHGHGLLYLPDDLSTDLFPVDHFPALIDRWQWATGNHTHDRKKWNALNLSHYDKKRGAGGYCAKYVFKSDADYDMLT